MEEIVKKYQKSVRAFVAQRIDDEGVVEELTNDILMAAIQSWPSFDGRCSEFSWICSIARHKIIDYYRKRKLKTILFSASPLFEEIADKSLTPERDCLKNELKDEIGRTMEEINEGYKKILRLKYIDGLRIKEIAGRLKMSVKAVESRLMRAKRQFRLAWNYDRQENKKHSQD